MSFQATIRFPGRDGSRPGEDQRFAFVPRPAYRLPAQPTAKWVYGALGLWCFSKSVVCWPSNEEIQDALSMPRRTLQKWLRVLEGRSLIACLTLREFRVWLRRVGWKEGREVPDLRGLDLRRIIVLIPKLPDGVPLPIQASERPAPSKAPEPAPSKAPEPAPSKAPEPAPSKAPEPAPSKAPEPAPSLKEEGKGEGKPSPVAPEAPEAGPAPDGTGRDGSSTPLPEWPGPEPGPVAPPIPPAESPPDLAAEIALAERLAQRTDALGDHARRKLEKLRAGIVDPPTPAPRIGPVPANLHLGSSPRAKPPERDEAGLPVPGARAAGRHPPDPAYPLAELLRLARARGEPGATEADLRRLVEYAARRFRDPKPETAEFWTAALGKLAPGEVEGLLGEADRKRHPPRWLSAELARILSPAREKPPAGSP